MRIDFPAPVRDRFTGLAEPAGCVTLNGDAALAFVRSRHYETDTNGVWSEDPTADLGRIRRQQLALRQLAGAAESRLGTDPRPLLRALFANVTVDSGFTADDALRYFTAIHGDPNAVTMTLPTSVAGANAGSLVLDTSAAQPVLDALAGRGPLPMTSTTAASNAPSGTGNQSFEEPTAC